MWLKNQRRTQMSETITFSSNKKSTALYEKVPKRYRSMALRYAIDIKFPKIIKNKMWLMWARKK